MLIILTLQNNLERSEHETKYRLSKQIESLERERTFLNKKLETEEKQHTAVNKHWEVIVVVFFTGVKIAPTTRDIWDLSNFKDGGRSPVYAWVKPPTLHKLA